MDFVAFFKNDFNLQENIQNTKTSLNQLLEKVKFQLLLNQNSNNDNSYNNMKIVITKIISVLITISTIIVIIIKNKLVQNEYTLVQNDMVQKPRHDIMATVIH